jgi:hypothetical protein
MRCGDSHLTLTHSIYIRSFKTCSKMRGNGRAPCATCAHAPTSCPLTTQRFQPRWIHLLPLKSIEIYVRISETFSFFKISFSRRECRILTHFIYRGNAIARASLLFCFLTLYENQVLGLGSHDSLEGAACGRLRFALAPLSKQLFYNTNAATLQFISLVAIILKFKKTIIC